MITIGHQINANEAELSGGEKETSQRQIGEKKIASRLPLTEIDLNKLNPPAVEVSSCWVFLLPFKT